MSMCPWLGLCLGLPEPWPLCWTFLPLPRIQMLVGSGVRNWPLKGGFSAGCCVVLGHLGPLNRTRVPVASGPLGLSPFDRGAYLLLLLGWTHGCRQDVWSQVFGTPGGCGWRGCPVSICLPLALGLGAGTHPYQVHLWQRHIHRLTLSLSLSLTFTLTL